MLETKLPSLLSQYISNLSLERHDIGSEIINKPPNTNVTGDYKVQNLETPTPKIVIALKVEISYEEQLALMLKIEYVANVNTQEAPPSEINTFLYLEYPPILLTEIRQIVANLTEVSGLHKVLIDPWGVSREIIKEIEKGDS
ncbi:MAG: protein-export chaperone SecB [Rickettsiaceae bacterium]